MRLTIVCFCSVLICLFTLSACSPILYNGFATNRYVTLLQEDESQSKPTSCPNSCADYLNYIPDTVHPEFTPMRYVRINCHFVNSTDSLVPDWCTYKPEASIHINRGDTIEWLGVKDFAGNIVIHNRAQLTLRCNLSLPQGADIKVCKRGTLFIDGGAITNTCSQKWQGIKVRSGIFTKSKILLQRNAQVL